MRTGIQALFICLMTCLPASAQMTTADVTGGRIEGVVKDSLTIYKGVPFAAPPVGELRWRDPQPVQPWQGVRKADASGPDCMQDAAVLKYLDKGQTLSEDCLYLNVWTPAKAATEKLPVMVWIHGGGFVGGTISTPFYDGTHLAQKGAVIVSLSYRLGRFGFMAHPELSKESGHGSGNYGIQDQIAALKWVQANIAKFGGDPKNVTIFGESAGAISVSILCGSPLAKGLFARAISESGGSFTPPATGAMGNPTLAAAEANGVRFFAGLGAADLKAARALSADTIQNNPRGTATGRSFWPAFDGYVRTGDQYLQYQQGKYNDTPVLIGTNADEGALFVKEATPDGFEKSVRAGYGEKADAILAAYPHATPKEALKAAKDLMRDTAFGWPTWAWANLQSRTGKGKVFVYYFEHKTPQEPDGASHSAEMTFVFNNKMLWTPSADPSDPLYTDQMMGYWINFAKTGDPNGPGLPAWPAFAADTAQVLRIAPTGAISYPNTPRLKALEDYYAWRRAHGASH